MARSQRSQKSSRRGNASDNTVVKFPPTNKEIMTKKIVVSARNPEQKEYLSYLDDDDVSVVIASGKAGTGKTFVAAAWAVKQMIECGKKIVVVRPNVALDERDIGYLPGNIIEKMAPWVQNVFDILKSNGFTKEAIEKLVLQDKIELVPLAYIRGRSFENTVIIADEVQNISSNGMLSLLTRIGEGSKMILCGDVTQTDLEETSGLADFLYRFKNTPLMTELIREVKLVKVERSPVVDFVLKLYGQ